jgi:hypothetical protein
MNAAMESSGDRSATFFPMSFRTKARLVIRSLSGHSGRVTIDDALDRRPITSRTLYFSALYRESAGTTAYAQYAVLQAKGEGLFVGMNLFDSGHNQWSTFDIPWKVLGSVSVETSLPDAVADASYATIIPIHQPTSVEERWQDAEMRSGFLDATYQLRHYAMVEKALASLPKRQDQNDHTCLRTFNPSSRRVYWTR